MRGRSSTWRALLALALALALAVAVGCGGDDDSDDGSSDAGGGGQAAGQIDVAPRTIGVTSIVLTAGSSQRLLEATKQAADMVGWKVIECDAAGDARKSDTCVTSLMQQGADAVLSMGSEPSLLRKSLAQAERRDVPVINIGGTVSDPSAFDASYAPDDKEFARVLNERMLADLGDEEATIGAYVNDAIVAIKERTDVLREQVGERPSLQLEEMSTANYTDPFASSRQAAQSLLRANPDTKALWGTGTTNVPGAVAAVDSLNKAGQVKVYGFYIDDALKDLLQQQKVAAVADTSLGVNSFTAIDQLLALWDGGGEIDPSAAPVEMEYPVYTPENVDEADAEPTYPEEFERRWAERYGS